MKTLLPFISLALTTLASADKMISSDRYQTTLFEDSFSKEELHQKWNLYKASSKIKEGAFVCVQQKGADHSAVHALKNFKPFSDGEINVDIKFEGARAIHIAFNDKSFEGSHAGHICRVTIAPTSLILRDGKTGIFDQKIRATRKEGKYPASVETFLKTKEKTVPLALSVGSWYRVSVRVQGDVLQAFIDGKQVGSFTSEGIAHATKNHVAFVVGGDSLSLDNVKIKTL